MFFFATTSHRSRSPTTDSTMKARKLFLFHSLPSASQNYPSILCLQVQTFNVGYVINYWVCMECLQERICWTQCFCLHFAVEFCVLIIVSAHRRAFWLEKERTQCPRPPSSIECKFLPETHRCEKTNLGKFRHCNCLVGRMVHSHVRHRLGAAFH